MADEVYTIKEMIAEFREDVSAKFDEVNKRLESIDNRQAVANGRTAKLELWQKLIIGGAVTAWTIFLMIGGLFAKLYIQDIARETARETASEVVKTISNKYEVEIK